MRKGQASCNNRKDISEKRAGEVAIIGRNISDKRAGEVAIIGRNISEKRAGELAE